MKKVAFSKGNKYLGDDVWSFNLPSGYTCPYADACLAYTDRETGKLQKGPNMQFKCYSAAIERYPNVRSMVWENFDALQGESIESMVDMISKSIPKKAKKIRVHAGGDFFSSDYFNAWMLVAKGRPDIEFWAFTKSLPIWIKNKGNIPDNFTLTASFGGKKDHLIHEHRLKYAMVVPSKKDAEAIGLPIDNHDVIAREKGQSFLLVDNFSKDKARG